MLQKKAIVRSIVIISILVLSILFGLLVQVIWNAIDRSAYPREFSEYVEKYSY